MSTKQEQLAGVVALNLAAARVAWAELVGPGAGMGIQLIGPDGKHIDAVKAAMSHYAPEIELRGEVEVHLPPAPAVSSCNRNRLN